ncbi:MAG: nicotinate (nicotinamide) nucleotide adenylyltransferase, partial [Candidatus Gastranaerophilales bacterium]|nr:nicotinate (nicotinamide) nucleotide adenylyltransferase [Candidatus Gastranaerophilales bacterium]
MSLCVFQGTFNPIHKIHLQVAKFAKEYYGFKKILFIPAYIPPHKTIDKSLAAHRFNMVKLAISKFKGFQISDIEYKKENSSYTYNTILELRKQYNLTDERIGFLIGTDAFEKIESWSETDKLKELVHFIVFQRTNNFTESNFDYLKNKGYSFEFAPMNFTDVSSTALRNNLRNGLSIKDIEIDEVREYIKEHAL